MVEFFYFEPTVYEFKVHITTGAWNVTELANNIIKLIKKQISH